MRSSYSRPLNTPTAVQDFLQNSLQYPDCKDFDNVVSKIIKGELGLSEINGKSPTLHNSTFRNSKFKTDSSRWKLRKQIVNELYTMERLDSDENIKLKSGGALPKSGAKHKSQAFLITGLPASGKSSISVEVAEKGGAVILDSDFAKRKLPEYKYYEFGGTVVHEESDSLIFGYNASDKPTDFECLLEKCAKLHQNICIPKIGYDSESLLQLCKGLKRYNYEIHFILVSLDRKLATIRAIIRYLKTKRYIPLGLIFDGYGNDPDIAYYKLRELNKKDKIFKTMGQLSTDVPIGTPPIIIDSCGKSPVLKIGIKK